MVVGVIDGLRRVGVGQVLSVILSVNVVQGSTVGSEVGRLVDECSGPGVGTRDEDIPEGTAEVNLSEFIGI